MIQPEFTHLLARLPLDPIAKHSQRITTQTPCTESISGNGNHSTPTEGINLGIRPIHLHSLPI